MHHSFLFMCSESHCFNRSPELKTITMAVKCLSLKINLGFLHQSQTCHFISQSSACSVSISSNLYDNCPACICSSCGAQAVVADGGEEDGHSGELRTRDPALVGYREGENNEGDRQDKVEVGFQIVPAKVGLCLLHIETRFETYQQRRQRTKVCPSLEVKREREKSEKG